MRRSRTVLVAAAEAAAYQAKIWGETTCLLATASVQVHRIRFERGGVCSMHRHVHRSNSFYVVSGLLEVVVAGVPHRLGPGAFLTVPPGILHRFEAISDGVALEIYHLPALSLEDIERKVLGFRKPAKQTAMRKS